MGQNEKGESKIIYRLLLNRRRRKKNRELRSFFFKVDINNERYCFVFTYRLSVKYKKKKSRIFDKKKQFKLILSFFCFYYWSSFHLKTKIKVTVIVMIFSSCKSIDCFLVYNLLFYPNQRKEKASFCCVEHEKTRKREKKSS